VKCDVNSELELLFIKQYDVESLICVNMVDRKVVFETAAYSGGHHSHHWGKVNGVHLLAVQSSKNEIKFFSVDSETKQFTEDEARRITFLDSDTVNHVDYDAEFENVYLVKNKKVFEQRALSGDQGVVASVELEGRIDFNEKKRVSVSSDGRYWAIATGFKYWNLVDIQNQSQFKLVSEKGVWSFSSTFIEGDAVRVVIGGDRNMEIWDVEFRSPLRVVSDIGHQVQCLCSVNNVLAVSSYDKVLQLYDTNSWNKFYSKKYEMMPQSLQLTSDLKYLVMAGEKGELCLVLKITV